jgi:DNA-binding CsgD family transcriptional regulator
VLRNLNKHINDLRIGIDGYFENLIGKKEDFSFDHRFFNFICLIIAGSYILRILINLIIEINHIGLTLLHISSFIGISIILYMSRSLRKVDLAKYLLIIMLLTVFSLNWFFTGGTDGVMLFDYFYLFTIIVFISNRRHKILAISIIIINVSLLLFIERMYPDLIVQKIGEQKLIFYKFFHFLLISGLTVIMINTAKKLYWMDIIQNSEINGTNHNHTNGQSKQSEIVNNLTVQERRVLGLILEGKANKEIASILYIDICTVKTHINNIYKKIGVNSRSSIFSLLT